MLNGKKLTTVLAGSLAAIAVCAPVAQANNGGLDVPVCNQATPQSLGGPYDTDGTDKNPPARFQHDLETKPGEGRGLENAAEESPALALCAPDDVPPGGGEDDGGITLT